MTEITYEIWQDDMIMAGSDDYADACHYANVYQQDGPVKLYKVIREEIAPCQPN